MRYRYRNPVRSLFSGLYSILWLVIIIIFFATGGHFWVLFLIGALLSAVLGIVIRLVMAGIIGAGIFGAASMMSNQQQQPPYQQYQPPYQPYQQPDQPYQPYQQGYQPPQQPPATYQEGGQQYPSQPQQPQYEQPQVHYPQELPPQQ
jgi:predicted lipid-binding transport protein (Tim44 family)